MIKTLFLRFTAYLEHMRFKRMINSNASNMAVMLTLSGSLQPPRFSSWWLK